jgi:hypothetical protein
MVRTRNTPSTPPPVAAPAPPPEGLFRRLLGWHVAAWLAWLVFRCALEQVRSKEIGRALRDSLGGPYDWSDAARTWTGHGRGLAVAALLCLAAVGWGRPFTAWFRTRRTGWTVNAGLGFVALGLATWGVGLLGLLAPGVLAALAAPALIAVHGWRARRRTGATGPTASGWPAGRLAPVFAALAGAFLCIYVWPAFAPELGWDALARPAPDRNPPVLPREFLPVPCRDVVHARAGARRR